MRIGQQVVYVCNVVGSIKGIVSHKSTNDKVEVAFSDRVYGDFKRTLPTNKLYKCRN